MVDDASQQKRHAYVEHGKDRGPFGRVDLAVGGRHACRAGHGARRAESALRIEGNRDDAAAVPGRKVAHASSTEGFP